MVLEHFGLITLAESWPWLWQSKYLVNVLFSPKLYYPSNYPKPRSHIPNQAAGTKLSGRCDRVTNVPWRSMVGRWFISFWNSSIFGEIRSFSVVYELDDVSRTTFCVGPLVETSGKKRYRKKICSLKNCFTEDFFSVFSGGMIAWNFGLAAGAIYRSLRVANHWWGKGSKRICMDFFFIQMDEL